MNSAGLDSGRLAAAKPGDVLATISLPAVTMTQLAFYCAAIGVPDPIHYDREFAKRSGFQDAIVNGSLRVAWMAQILADLVPLPGLLARLVCSHRAPLHVGDAPAYQVILARFHEEQDRTAVAEVRVECRVADRLCDVGEASLRLAATTPGAPAPGARGSTR